MAIVHERLHPLEAVGARGHGGRSTLVARIAVGLNVLLPDDGSISGVHVGLALLVGPDETLIRIANNPCKSDLLVETKDHGTEIGGVHGALERADPLAVVTPEHDPVVETEVIGALRLRHVPVVDTGANISGTARIP